MSTNLSNFRAPFTTGGPARIQKNCRLQCKTELEKAVMSREVPVRKPEHRGLTKDLENEKRRGAKRLKIRSKWEQDYAGKKEKRQG